MNFLMKSINCPSLAARAFLVLSASALAQTNVPGHVLDANNQVTNQGDKVFINSESPARLRTAQPAEVQQHNNRYSDQYQTFPLGSGSGYVNGYGPFPNIRQLFPSRFSYELHAPLYTPYNPYARDVNGGASPYIYRSSYDPYTHTTTASTVAAPLATNMVAGSQPIETRLNNAVDTRLQAGAGAPTGQSSVTRKPTYGIGVYDVRNKEITCTIKDKSVTIVGDTINHTELANLATDIRLASGLNDSIKNAKTKAVAVDRFHSSFDLGSGVTSGCANFTLTLPSTLHRGPAMDGVLNATGCAAPFAPIKLSCTIK